MLCATRFVQGIGAAMASAVVLSMIITLFRRAGDRGRALALCGFVGAAGSSIGLLAGGVISRTLSWPWIFLINAPLGLAAILAVRWTVPRTAPAGRRPDVAGALLATGGLMLAVYALVATSLSWPEELLLGVAALIWLSLFLARQTRVVNPLLPLRLLASRSTGLANLVQALMVAGLFGFQFPGVQYLQRLLPSAAWLVRCHHAFAVAAALAALALVLATFATGIPSALGPAPRAEGQEHGPGERVRGAPDRAATEQVPGSVDGGDDELTPAGAP